MNGAGGEWKQDRKLCSTFVDTVGETVCFVIPVDDQNETLWLHNDGLNNLFL